MSINNVMLSGVAGLVANSSALGAISDNIANVNTVGYKQNVTQFEDLVTTSDSAGAYNPGGVQANVSALVNQQGQLTQTSSPTDLAISGNGFFAVTATSAGTAGDVTPSYTRAGNFTADSSGYLKNSAGMYLQGWVADSQGVITTDPSNLSKLSTINVSDIGSAPDPTTEDYESENLNAGQAISTAVSSGLYSAPSPTTLVAATPTETMAAYTASNGASGVMPDYSNQMTFYDAKGGAHTMQMDALKSTTPNQWNVEVVAVPASDVKGTTNGLVAAGVIAFNPDGTLDPAHITLSQYVAIGASTATTGVTWATALGLPAQSVKVNPVSETQYNSPSVTTSTAGNGGPAGTLSGVTVQSNGDVVASFSNGASKTIAQLAVATFPNEDGLQSASGDAYNPTNSSGAVSFQQPGVAGSGTISSNALESSTVDLSTQFTGLITTQRAYQASSKIITTADQMLQSLLQVIQ